MSLPGASEGRARHGVPAVAPAPRRDAARGSAVRSRVDRGWSPGSLPATVFAHVAAVVLVAWAAGGGVIGSGAAALAAGLVSGAVWFVVRRRAHRDFTLPLADLRDAVASRNHMMRVAEVGARPVAQLARCLNDTLALVFESSRQSQAQLLSVEVAFDRIHSVLHSLVEGVVVVDAIGEVVLANPAARSLFVGDRRPVEGRPLPALLEGELRHAVTLGLKEIETDNREHVPHASVPHQNRVHDIDIVRVHSNRRDQDFGFVIVFRDVTSTYEIARLKDEFLSSVSHELRTPLTNICAYAEILTLMRPGEDKEWSEFLKIIQDEGSRLTSLVDNVLDYTKLETGKIVWDVETVSFAEIARNALQAFRPNAERKNVRLESFVSADATVAVDRMRLQQVVINVLDNALKFTPPGERIRVRVTAEGESCHLAVHDSGPGVPHEERERVFERLHQLGDTMTDKPSGAGLGLAICRLILDRFDGTIRCADSELGGACFEVRLPVSVASPVDGATPAEAAR